MKQCPNCKTTVSEDAKVCARCWNILPVTKIVTKTDYMANIKKYAQKLQIQSLIRIDTKIDLPSDAQETISELKSAVQTYIANVGLTEELYDIFNLLGNYYLIKNDYNAALENYDLALSTGVQKKELFYHKGVIFYKLKKYKEAIEVFDKALQLDPLFPEVHYLKGLVLIYEGKLHQGLKFYRSATKIKPEIEKTGYSK